MRGNHLGEWTLLYDRADGVIVAVASTISQSADESCVIVAGMSAKEK